MIPETRVVCPLCDGTRTRHERVVAGFALDRCESCGHVFMNPQFSAEQITELYRDRNTDDLTAIYSRIAASPSVIAEYDRKLALLEDALPGRGRLLDFACGSGAFFERAQQRGWDAHGTELGEWARHAAARRQLQNLHVGTLSDLAFPSSSFDVVYAAQVFEHLPHPAEELAEIRRILRPNGVLYVDVPNYRTLSIVLGRDDFMLNEPPQHVNYFSPATLRDMLTRNGFDVTKVASGGGLKWENVIGRPIRSDIASAYGLVSGPSGGARARGPSMVRRLKSVLVSKVVKPLLYERLRVGMVLFAVSRKRPG
jgi:2-polyprenyl-3-methyl-5-hydroxy-6-metoxy-1,4-benzoquinol methylase